MAEPATEERLLVGYTGRLFLSFSFGWLMIQLGLQLLPPLLPHIIDALSITAAQAGFAFTLYWLMYAVTQYPSGRFSDQLSRKTLLVGGIGLAIVGFLILSGATIYPLFLLGVTVVGLGSGLYPTPARALISDLFVVRRGQAMGLHSASGDVGTALAAGVAVLVVAIGTWRLAFLPVGIVLGAVALAIHVSSRERYVLTAVNLGVRTTSRRIFRDPRLWQVFLPYAMYVFVWQSATGFLPTFLYAEKGFSTELASGAFGLLFVVGMLVKPISGTSGDRLDHVLVAAGTLVLAIAGLAIVLASGHTVLILAGVVVFAAGLLSFSPVMQAYLLHVLADSSMGGDFGAIRTLAIGFGAIGPTYVGFVAGVSSYQLAFAGLLVSLAVSALLLVRLSRQPADPTA